MYCINTSVFCFFFFQAEDGIRDKLVTGVQTCALPISGSSRSLSSPFFHVFGQEAPNLILGVLRRIALVLERMTAAVSGSDVIKVVVGTLIDLHAQWRGVGVHQSQAPLHIPALLGPGPVVPATDQHEYRNAKRFSKCVAAPGVERDGGAELVR